MKLTPTYKSLIGLQMLFPRSTMMLMMKLILTNVVCELMMTIMIMLKTKTV